MASNRKKVMVPHTMGKEGVDLLQRRDDSEQCGCFSAESIATRADWAAARYQLAHLSEVLAALIVQRRYLLP